MLTGDQRLVPYIGTPFRELAVGAVFTKLIVLLATPSAAKCWYGLPLRFVWCSTSALVGHVCLTVCAFRAHVALWHPQVDPEHPGMEEAVRAARAMGVENKLRE